MAVAMVAATAAYAQSSNPADPRSFDASQVGGRVTLGPEWLFHAGDDPAWAQPGSDDSGWRTVSAEKQLPEYGIRNIHYGWYRIHIHVNPNARNLSVGVAGVSGSYEVYANGLRIGGNGEFAGVAYREQIRLLDFPIPEGSLENDGALVLALRFRLRASGNRGIGSSTPINAGSGLYLYSGDGAKRDETYLLSHRIWDRLSLSALCMLMALIALSLFASLRQQREYLGAAVYLVALGGLYLLDCWEYSADSTPPSQWLVYSTFGLTNVAMIEFIRLVLGVRRTRWLLLLEVIAAISGLWSPLATFGLKTFYLGFAGFFGAIFIVNLTLIVLLAKAWRQGNREARILLPAVVLLGINRYWSFFRFLAYYLHWTAELNQPPSLHFGSYKTSLNVFSDFAFLIAILLFLVLRTVGIAREKARIAGELEAARTMQQLLLAREGQATPGFEVESVYYPANEVGGDFFLVASREDGSLIATVGDVSGKGLQAAMRVSMILGVLRREDSWEPGVVLRNLNEALQNSGQAGFTTACCVRIDGDGRGVVANAGHVAPYLDGEELETAASLPLGLVSGQVYEETPIVLQAGQGLVLMSDGVVEARAADGALLGFERVAELARKTASEIADAARAFGQDDDITVLTLTFASAGVSYA
jgi:hypothetical protein